MFEQVVAGLDDTNKRPHSSPGFLDIQINGAYGFDFSVYEKDDDTYRQGLETVATRIVETGVTSYVVQPPRRRLLADVGS